MKRNHCDKKLRTQRQKRRNFCIENGEGAAQSGKEKVKESRTREKAWILRDDIEKRKMRSYGGKRRSEK